MDSLKRFVESEATLELDGVDLVHKANFFFDGFVHCIGSSMDVFAREVLSYFDVALPPRVYYYTAHRILAHRRPGDPILRYLEDPSWRTEFSDYRNACTHELIVSPQYTMAVYVGGPEMKRSLAIPLPDDPRGDRNHHGRNPRIEEYCERTLKRSLRHFNIAYGQIGTRIRAAGRLPL